MRGETRQRDSSTPLRSVRNDIWGKGWVPHPRGHERREGFHGGRVAGVGDLRQWADGRGKGAVSKSEDFVADEREANQRGAWHENLL